MELIENERFSDACSRPHDDFISVCGIRQLLVLKCVTSGVQNSKVIVCVGMRAVRFR